MRAHILIDGKLTRTTSADVVRAAHAAGRPISASISRTARRRPTASSTRPSTFTRWWSRTSGPIALAPKIDQFDDYLYVVVHGISAASRPTQVDLWVFDVVIGPTFVITQCNGDTSAADALTKRLERSSALLEQGPPWIAHAILDGIVDRYLPLIASLGEQIDAVERDVVEKAGKPDGTDLLARSSSP